MNKALLARLANLSLRVRQFYDLPVIGQVPITALVPSLEFDGAILNPGSVAAMVNALNQYNIADSAANFQSSAAASITLTNLLNLYQKLTNGGAVTVTLDSAYNIVNQMLFPWNGQAFLFSIFSSGAGTVATPTLSDTAVTLSGTTSITAGNRRTYNAQVTQLFTTVGAPMTAGTTFTSIAQVGSTNNYTVTLATNALVPVVGQVIFINVTAGTLPPGWYPINKVTSATSFVVALPPAGTAWTATAATIPGTTLVPVSQYTAGSPLTGPAGSVGVYSPLMTITAVESVAAIV